MNSIINSVIRDILGLLFFVLGKLLIALSIFERKNLSQKWQALKRNDSPTSFEEQRERLKFFAEKRGESFILVKTSGTRNIPKEVPYTKSRLKEVERTFSKAMIILISPFKGRKTFFVFASIDKDSSLTSGMMDQSTPNRIALLQAPYRYLMTKEGQALREKVGNLTARLILIVLTRPRFLYATNPSTLTHFFDEIQLEWPSIRLQLKDFYSPDLDLLIEGDGWKRLKKITQSEECPKIIELLPKLQGIIAWDGGYVASFTERLSKILPTHVVHIPMFSMSTETIETLPHRIKNKLHFLPSMKNIYPEFMDAHNIYAPSDVHINKIYTLLVTDTYGLVRYDTQDEFLVVGMINGLPDLKFKRRRNITASMMGEKITENHAENLFIILKSEFPLSDMSLSLYGKITPSSSCYHLVLIGARNNIDLKSIALRAEEILQSLNVEYADKVKSGRLKKLATECITIAEFARLMGQEYKWESQFKVMPLYEKPLTKN